MIGCYIIGADRIEPSSHSQLVIRYVFSVYSHMTYPHSAGKSGWFPSTYIADVRTIQPSAASPSSPPHPGPSAPPAATSTFSSPPFQQDSPPGVCVCARLARSLSLSPLSLLSLSSLSRSRSRSRSLVCCVFVSSLRPHLREYIH